MHRVLNLTSTGISAEVMESLKRQIRDKLTEYTLHESQVNDGSNDDDQPTLAVSADFNSASEANEFHEWLKILLFGYRSDLTFAQTRIHDCNHAADQNRPCVIGDVLEVGVDGA